MFLLVGLPGAGKTTVAKRLSVEHAALRLTPDEWMNPLFGEPDAGGKRDVLEGRLLTVALQVLRLGVGVVLDFGCWSRDERSALRWLTEQVGASFSLVYLPVEPAVQWQRIASRQPSLPEDTFSVTRADLGRWRRLFEAPEADELAGRTRAEPPSPWTSWPAWAQHRWPSLSV